MQNIINTTKKVDNVFVDNKEMTLVTVYQDIFVNGDIISATRYTFYNGKTLEGDTLIIDKGETYGKKITSYKKGTQLLRELQII